MENNKNAIKTIVEKLKQLKKIVKMKPEVKNFIRTRLEEKMNPKIKSKLSPEQALGVEKYISTISAANRKHKA